MDHILLICSPVDGQLHCFSSPPTPRGLTFLRKHFCFLQVFLSWWWLLFCPEHVRGHPSWDSRLISDNCVPCFRRRTEDFWGSRPRGFEAFLRLRREGGARPDPILPSRPGSSEFHNHPTPAPAVKENAGIQPSWVPAGFFL